MIKILILDDSREKLKLITDFIISECHVDMSLIDVGTSIKDGRKILYENSYDLLLLDLVMPRDSESEASPEESLSFLNEIYYNSQIHIPVHIIGFTQFDNLIESHIDEFEDKLWHLINFDYSDNEWRDKLKNKICHLISVKERFKESLEHKNQFDIGILCALETPELVEVLDLPWGWKSFQIDQDPFIYHSGTLQTKNGNTYKAVACAVNTMGMHASAAISAMMIAKFRLSYIFMIGICAGVKSRGVNYGDVIIAESALDYGFGKMTENANKELVFKPEPHQIPSDQDLLSKVHNFIRLQEEMMKIPANFKGDNSPGVTLKAFVGPIASGSYVVSSTEFVGSIIEHNRKLIGLDMESYGLYLACHFFNNTKALFIKSVSDFGDLAKEDKYQRYAAFTSARFLNSLLVNMF